MGSGIVWADCEMTGLDVENDALIEIGVIVTDDQLNILDDGIDLVIHASDEQLAKMGDYVRDMHERSGLTQQVRESSLSLEQAQDRVLSYLGKYVKPHVAPLAGNSIGTDRGFIVRYMPKLNDFLHYRMIDVSSLKELSRRWYPQVYYHKPEKGLAHRALADIKESIIELQYYRKALFIPEPGLSSDELRAIDVGR